MSVLVAVSGDRRTDDPLAVGAALADAFETELVALHVMPQGRYESARADREDGRPRWHWTAVAPSSSPGAADRSPGPTSYPIDAAANDAAGTARAVARETLGPDAPVTVEGRVGDPVEQLLGEADRRAADYIVVGGRKRTAVGKAVFGSVTQSVLLAADRPVVTVPIEGLTDARDGPVVAAVDRSDRAARVVAEADRLASALDRPLHVVHVARETDSSRPDGATDPPTDDDRRDEAADVAAGAADGVAEPAAAVGLVGAAGQRLLEYATDEDAAAIVTAGRKRSPVGKVLFGSVTQSVLLGADRPVLTVMVED